MQSKDTALIYATGKGRIDIVRYLCEHGANVQIQNRVSAIEV